MFGDGIVPSCFGMGGGFRRRRELMRMRAFLASLLIVPALAVGTGGCAPTAVQMASFAIDGAAYLATGKGTTDLALSAASGDDCRVSNLVKGREVCVTKSRGTPIDAIANLPAGMSSEQVAALAAIAPAAGHPAADMDSAGHPAGIWPRLRFIESPGLNLVDVSAVAPGSSLAGQQADNGDLLVYLVSPVGDVSPNVLFAVPGYTHNPGAFTGVLMNNRFFAPDSFIN
jgi:hypothetical protein